MKSLNHDTGTYAFLGLLVATVWAIPLAALLHRDAHGSPMDLPRCDEARSLDQVRSALEEKGGGIVLGLHSAVERGDARNPDLRRCTAIAVTAEREAVIGFSIGWHDRQNGLPFWAGDVLKPE